MSQYFYWWWTALEELPGENTKEIFQDEKHEDFHKLFSLQSGIGRYCHPSHGWVWLKLFTSCKGKNFNILFDLLMCPFREHETNGKVLYFKGRFPIIQHLVILKRQREWNYLNPTGSVVSVSPSPFKVEILNYVKSVIFPNTKLGNKSFLMWTRIAFQYFWVSLFLFAQATMIKSHNTNIKNISDKKHCKFDHQHHLDWVQKLMVSKLARSFTTINVILIVPAQCSWWFCRQSIIANNIFLPESLKTTHWGHGWQILFLASGAKSIHLHPRTGCAQETP